ncbi:methylated-DNA--[protein]-cysteine S-methyltransferase [Oerskovia turbata]|uniref:Methylated-DNA--[protein]-cysteine S-methyltransferase n=1 Tax=Oerskovia turbata TaxID=1713 RepID=A0A4V1N5N8_9CELL|nr:methylated-DNA--[protein]-cysteine S-methyltransferase [Oerskovia turbata]RXR27101.1 methylated-DNA--[protein]-cysteine S-methyltransferase [Oerskovia turbata]RXR36331.1 methylated-DNA--[protein]-cysteine S-methyltransferase [Oerskovia turbata]TGJ95504.1 methylated-DNA--[protein]-cysteine S-methyltransferase [Actinotalea fermentans ATCC 43279 = JCM 9966 = DSM 3133]
MSRAGTSDTAAGSATAATAERVGTPVGPLWVVTEGEVLVLAGFAPDLEQVTGALGVPTVAARVRTRQEGASRAAAAVAAYLEGDLGALDRVAVRQPGTPRMQDVWRRLRAVPAGATTTYGTLLPEAPRLAARACAVNRVTLFVPCHRVHRADGHLGGYTWGLEVKTWLRDFEASSPTGGS